VTLTFYVAAAIALVATLLAVTRTHAVHALLYFVVSLLSSAVVFLTLGAPFVAALEVIVYAGAIIVLFIFVVMLLNLGPDAAGEEKRLLSPGIWIGPCLLSLALGIQLVWVATAGGGVAAAPQQVGPREVSLTLMGPYVLGVEAASMLLLAGLVGAYQLGRRAPREDRS
jgi:NADH-quinone oxidoreductase subunit J